MLDLWTLCHSRQRQFALLTFEIPSINSYSTWSTHHEALKTALLQHWVNKILKLKTEQVWNADVLRSDLGLGDAACAFDLLNLSEAKRASGLKSGASKEHFSLGWPILSRQNFDQISDRRSHDSEITNVASSPSLDTSSFVLGRDFNDHIPSFPQLVQQS